MTETGLENRVYLVTGAALRLSQNSDNIDIENVDIDFLKTLRPNLGGAYILELAKHHPKALVFCDIKQKNLRALERILQHNGIEARGLHLDVTDGKKCRELVEETIASYGSLDGVVVNAGFNRDAFMQKMTLEQWQPVVDIHEKGFLNIVKPAFDYARSRETAEMNFLIITSTSGLFGLPSQVNYGGGKLFVVGATHSLAEEMEFKSRNTGYQWNVVANCLAPLASTEMTGNHPITINPVYGPEFTVDFKDPTIKEKYSPEAVAPMAAYLLSTKALGIVNNDNERFVDPERRLNKRIFYAGGREFKEIVIDFPERFNLENPTLEKIARNIREITRNPTPSTNNHSANPIIAAFDLYSGLARNSMRFASQLQNQMYQMLGFPFSR